MAGHLGLELGDAMQIQQTILKKTQSCGIDKFPWETFGSSN
jgi:hypothetical protein